jgi:hypothetical protein
MAKLSDTYLPQRDELSALRARVSELEAENGRLRFIVRDLHWMARRYADGRSTYAPGLFNEHTQALLDMNVALDGGGSDKTIWARDGMGRAYDGLTDEQAAGAALSPSHPEE